MSKTKTSTVTREEEITLREKLRREEAKRSLEPVEEQALRMLHGIGVDPHAPLPSKAQAGSEVGEALLMMEAELLRKMRRREVEIEEQNDVEEEAEEGPRPTDSRVKSKIVRALRKKE